MAIYPCVIDEIYSLGVLLGELVADATRARPDAELAGILAKARDADPARRYASAGAFRDDLERWRESVVTTLLVAGDTRTLRTMSELVLG